MIMNARFITAFAAIVMLLAFSGCSGESQLLDTIPADAPGIVTLNVEKLTDALDGAKHGGKLTLSETLDKFLTKSSERCHREITAILTSESIDRTLMAGFAITGKDSGIGAFKHSGDYTYTFKIKNLSALVDEIGASSTPETIDGFDVYELEDVNLVVKDKQGWLLWGDAAKAVATLSDELNRASNTPASSLKGIAKFLSAGDNIFHLAIARSEAADGWTCITGGVDDNAREMLFDAKFIDANGKEKDMDTYLKRIDQSLLDYTTPSDIFVLAMGIKGDTDWEEMLNYVQSVYPLDFSQRSFMGMILPYLKRLDGTIMIAGGLSDPSDLSQSNLGRNINFVVAIQLKKSEVKKTISDLRDIIAMVGLPVVDKGYEFVMQTPGSDPISLKAVDNTIVLTNRSLKQLGNNAARDAAKNNSFAIWANIPNSIGETVYGGNGFTLKMGVNDNFKMSFSFSDPTVPVFEQLALLISADRNPIEEIPASTETAPEATANDMGFTPLDTIR